MNLKEQRYICTLAQCGSITKAAKQLFISQPALSSYISGIEKELGLELFYREGKHLRLTYAGELYVEKANLMLAMQHEYQREVNNILHGIQGRVCIGMQRRRGPNLVVEISRRFEELYPSVELYFTLGTSTSLQQDYDNGQIDILILNHCVESAYTVNKVLMNEKVLLTVSRKDPIVGKSVYVPENEFRWLDLKLVEAYTFILPTKEQSLRVYCDRLLKKAGVIPRHIMEIGHIDTTMQMAAEGMGVCFTRESYAGQFQYVKRPVFLSVGNPVAEEPLYAIYQRESETNPYISAIVKIIGDVVRDIIAKHM